MNRLSLHACCLLVALAGSGCSEPRQSGLELTLHDGLPAAGEYHRVPVQIGARRSQYGAKGLYLEVRVRRAFGAVAEITLDLPYATSAAASTLARPRASYVERLGAQVIFSSSHVAGRVELSRDPSCPCQTGRLELQFTAEGPDGQLGTADDGVRRVSRARLRLDGRPFCHAAEVLPIRSDVLVIGARACPVSGHGGTGGVAAWGWSAGAWVEVEEGWNDDGWYDEGWCGDWSEEAPEEDPGAWEDGWTDPATDDTWSEGGGADDPGSDSSDGWSDDGSSDDGWSDDGSSDDGSGSDDGGWTDWGSDDGSDDSWDW